MAGINVESEVRELFGNEQINDSALISIVKSYLQKIVLENDKNKAEEVKKNGDAFLLETLKIEAGAKSETLTEKKSAFLGKIKDFTDLELDKIDYESLQKLNDFCVKKEISIAKPLSMLSVKNGMLELNLKEGYKNKMIDTKMAYDVCKKALHNQEAYVEEMIEKHPQFAQYKDLLYKDCAMQEENYKSNEQEYITALCKFSDALTTFLVQEEYLVSQNSQNQQNA